MDNKKPNLTEEQAAGLADLIQVSRENMEEMVRLRREVMERRLPDMLTADTDARAESEQGLRDLEAAIEAGDLSEYLADQRAQIAGMAEQGFSFELIGRALVELVNPMARMLESAFPKDPERSIRAIRALHELETEFLLNAGAAYASTREDSMETEFQNVIRRLSTPVIEVWDEVLVMPLVGVMDTTRAQQMMEHLLERIVAEQSRYVIVDITGVPTVDTAVAEHLIKTTRAGTMVGARTILVGISPQVAQTLVRLGVSLGDMATFTDLRSGLQHVFRQLGYQIERRAT